MNDTSDILLAQRFLPEHGGSIRWMHEVYRRWPGPVDVITHDYKKMVSDTISEKTVSDTIFREPVTDANLRMDRRDIFMADWGVESLDRLLRYARMTNAVHAKLHAAKGDVRIHCIHAVPEAVSLIPLHWRFGDRMNIICYAHGEEITACESSRQLRLLMRKAYAKVDHVIANSRYTAKLLENWIDPDRVSVIHPGVDIAEFDDADNLGRAWRRQNNLEHRRIILTLGRLDPRKNQSQVLRAVKHLAAKHDDLLYVIAGEGRCMDDLKQQTAESGMVDHVLFTGAVDGPTRLALYGACDVFAMPAIKDGTDVEGFGMVFLEAGACGKPSVAGNVGGQSDAVRDGETGYVVDGLALQQVADALDRLLCDEALRVRLGDAARTHAEQFDWPHVVERTLALVAGRDALCAASPS